MAQSIILLIKIDKTFLVPKLNLYMSYLINNIKESALDNTIIHIFYNYIKLSFDTHLSEAIDAGNKISFSLDNK